MNTIITIIDTSNYGNRLQNYALFNLLNKFSETKTFVSAKNWNLNYRILKFCLKSILNLDNRRYESLREIKSIYFTKKYIPITKKLLGHNVFKIIIGSDQVWNYRWITNKDLAFRLGFPASVDASVISYAASFGVSEVDDDVKPIFQRYLPRLKAISVREDRGAELVKEMTGLDATVVLDPTLMLTTAKWNTITRGFVPDDDRYVLTYFLGKPSDEQEKTIQSYAKAHGCRVRRILDLRDKETYVAGPQDFVELFSKAQYVFTDSYHACCFSILYHKQFTVFNRAGMEGKANMNSRMETLFRLFDLDSVVMDKGLAPRIDYDKVDKLLARHRAESQAWLDKAMEA